MSKALLRTDWAISIVGRRFPLFDARLIAVDRLPVREWPFRTRAVTDESPTCGFNVDVDDQPAPGRGGQRDGIAPRCPDSPGCLGSDGWPEWGGGGRLLPAFRSS